MEQFIISVFAGLVSGVAIFMIGLFWPILPKSIKKFKLRQFFGKSIFKSGVIVTYGAFKDSRHRESSPSRYWYDKHYHDRRWIAFVGPREFVVSACEIRSASYLISSISPYKKNIVKVLADLEVFPNLDNTIISLGGGASNEISRLALEEPENIFLEFVQESEDVIIHDKRSGNIYRGFKLPRPKDYGIILRIPNKRFPGKYFLVCAGIGEWGTSGASWYLANKWVALNKEFSGAFGIVVEVEIGSDESAIRVFKSTDKAGGQAPPSADALREPPRIQ